MGTPRGNSALRGTSARATRALFPRTAKFPGSAKFPRSLAGDDATAGPAAVARPAGRRLSAVPGGASLLRPAITGAVVARAPSGADGKNSLNGIVLLDLTFNRQLMLRQSLTSDL